MLDMIGMKIYNLKILVTSVQEIMVYRLQIYLVVVSFYFLCQCMLCTFLCQYMLGTFLCQCMLWTLLCQCMLWTFFVPMYVMDFFVPMYVMDFFVPMYVKDSSRSFQNHFIVIAKSQVKIFIYEYGKHMKI